MNSNSLSKGAWLLIILGLVVVAALGIRTISNSDFWLHLAMGRQVAEAGAQKADTSTFTVAGTPWVNSSWLYDRILFALWSLGGAPLVILLHAAAAVLAFALLIPPARKWAGGASLSMALVLGAWLLAPRFTIAPHVAAFPLAAAFVMLLSEPRKSWVLWAVLLPAQVIWVNIHPSFVLGPVICAVFAVQFWIASRSGDVADFDRFMQALWLTLATLLAGLVNPYGLALYAHGIVSLSSGAFKFVQEWISPFSGQFPGSALPKHIVTLALIVGAGGLIAEKRNLPIGITTLAVASAFLIILFPRNVEWMALLAFPFLALSLNSIGALAAGGLRSLTKQSSDGNPIAASLAVILAVLSILGIVTNACYVHAGSASVFGLGTEYDLFPRAASKVIERPDFPARAVNMASDGGFLAWEHPNRAIFTDQRASLYGGEFYRALNKCLAGEENAWQTILEKWNPEAVIMNCSIPFAANGVRLLLQDPSWSLVYFDGTAAILVRAISENQPLIQDAQIKDSGLQLIERERQRALKATSKQVLPRLMGAGELFLALGRYPEAESIYGALTRCTPMLGRVWINLGIAQAEQGKSQEAVATLKHACDIAPKEVYAWISLYRAARIAGLEDEARFAIEKAAKVNSTATALFKRSEQRAAEEAQSGAKPAAQ